MYWTSVVEQDASVLILSKRHLDVLVTAGLESVEFVPFQWDLLDVMYTLSYETADAIGQLLHLANVRSVDRRYEQNNPIGMYHYTEYKASPIQILKAIASYEYQSSEHDDWSESVARAFCEALRKAIVARLPEYGRAPWVWEDDTTVPTE